MASNGLLGPRTGVPGRDAYLTALSWATYHPHRLCVAVLCVCRYQPEQSAGSCQGAWARRSRRCHEPGRSHVETVGLHGASRTWPRKRKPSVSRRSRAHSTGYSPFLPYGPSGIGPYGVPYGNQRCAQHLALDNSECAAVLHAEHGSAAGNVRPIDRTAPPKWWAASRGRCEPDVLGAATSDHVGRSPWRRPEQGMLHVLRPAQNDGRGSHRIRDLTGSWAQ